VTGGRVCVTNTLPDLPACTIPGSHRVTCDGFARKWDVDTNQVVVTTRPCKGCAPRPAVAGYLCESCLTKLDAALDNVHELVAFMWQDNSNGVRDANEGGGRTGVTPNWTLNESRVMVAWVIASMRNAAAVLDGRDDIDLTYLDGPRLADPGQVDGTIPGLRLRLHVGRDDLISTPYGAEAAVRMTKTIQRAYAKFPLQERQRRIAGVRCPACSRSALVWSPPLYFRGDVVITCTNCGHTEPQSFLERYAEIMQTTAVGA